jgi:GrpB-like predicted nucleotidyltransferase (UPF0157 family)
MAPLVVRYDPVWPVAYATEAARLAPVLPELHHIGSTAVPGLAAKPTLDILGSVPGTPDLRALARLGYEVRGEAGIPGRLFLRLVRDGRRLVHLHLYAQGSQQRLRHLAFRDWLRAHPDRAAAYGAHKLALAARPGRTRADYVADKGDWVRAGEAEALAWAARCGAGHDSHRLRRR